MSKVLDKNLIMSSDKDFCQIKDKDNVIRALAERKEKLFKMMFKYRSKTVYQEHNNNLVLNDVTVCNIVETVNDWHSKLAHMNLVLKYKNFKTILFEGKTAQVTILFVQKIVVKNKTCYYEWLNKIHSALLFYFETPYEAQFNKIKRLHLRLDKSENNNKINFLAEAHKYHDSHTFVYTDASKEYEKVGYGVHIPYLHYNFSKLPGELSICSAEMVAIHDATRTILNKNIQKAIIFSDSLNAIQKLTNSKFSARTDRLTLTTKQLIHDSNRNGTEVSLAWIPGHAGIPGNELVDKLTNIGRILKVPRALDLDVNEIWPSINKQIKKKNTKFFGEARSGTEGGVTPVTSLISDVGGGSLITFTYQGDTLLSSLE